MLSCPDCPEDPPLCTAVGTTGCTHQRPGVETTFKPFCTLSRVTSSLVPIQLLLLTVQKGRIRVSIVSNEKVGRELGALSSSTVIMHTRLSFSLQQCKHSHCGLSLFTCIITRADWRSEGEEEEEGEGWERREVGRKVR